jgi:hypothetical protein
MSTVLPAPLNGAIDSLISHAIGNHRTADHPRQVRSAIRGWQTIRGNSTFEATRMLPAHS